MNPLHSPDSLLAPIDRRRAMQWMLAAVAATAAMAKLPANAGITEYKPTLRGYGTDPVLTKNYLPGDFWPLSFSESQRSSAAAICDILFPADEVSPSASSLHEVQGLPKSGLRLWALQVCGGGRFLHDPGGHERRRLRGKHPVGNL
ncbi:MAG: hypothetical protein EBS01_05935 [Verrucomicrobia bacterium]|nr:hypothetical protein [Verrucomicrobiota bacterium]